MKRKALILGISGQDGSYLAELLLRKNYVVVGTSRDVETASFDGLKRLGIHDRVTCRSMSLRELGSVIHVISDEEPDEIYNLAAQSSVGLSFERPLDTMDSILAGTLNVLEAVRLSRSRALIYNAASSECFGDTSSGSPGTEATHFRPKSPYGIAKAAAFWLVANYREAYSIHACSGILFNHESGLRPARFVTRKIIRSACRIAAGSKERLSLGNTDIVRDWGWAPEYVEAMWMMLQSASPSDYVIATGSSYSLAEFAAKAFHTLDLDWRDHTDHNADLLRPTDVAVSWADPSYARSHLGWTAKTSLDELISILVEEEMASQRQGR